MTAPCRAFEDRLLAALEAAPDAPARAAHALAASDPHAAACADCATLAALVAGQANAFAALRRPEASAELLERLAAEPEDAAARAETADVLSLLTPGALAKPEPSPELLARIAALGARAPAGGAVVRGGAFARVKPLVRDWRFVVAAAYAASFLVFAILDVDPMQAARGAASDLTARGERALTDARVAAVKRLDESTLARYAAPLTKRLDYRVYRAFAATRARASAYAQLVFEKIFGSEVESVQSASKAAPPEPSGPIRRS